MTADPRPWQRTFAESLASARGLRSARLIDALATVPRERFLGPGPWRIAGGRSTPAAIETTDGDDPRHVHRDVSVAIDEGRALFNGAPGIVASWIDRLDVQEGDRVLHIGCGTGYYSAILGAITGPSGSVSAFEIDAALAARARNALAGMPWIQVTIGDGLSGLPADADVLLVHAGATHIVPAWVDCLAPDARAAIPLTCTFPGHRSPLSKGIVVFFSRTDEGVVATAGDLVVIYALACARTDAANAALGRALANGQPPYFTRLRPGAHDEDDECWLHHGVCLGR